MHPKNLHKDGYNFDILSVKNPNLKQFIILNKLGKSTIDFSNDQAVLELNRSLLLAHYNVEKWSIPSGHLCPSVPGRSEYIHHLADLLNTVSKDVSVFDIGTGAGMIYPIIGNGLYNWNFTGSESNQESYENCLNILRDNPHFQSKIKIVFQKDSTKIFDNIVSENDHYDAAICNPPFFKDEEDALKAGNRKWRNLNMKHKLNQRNFSGTNSELHYPGGELGFINNIISESLHYPKNFKWFTSLVSNQRNITVLQQRLKKEKIKNTKVIDMNIGQKTTRILAWKVK